MPQQQQQQKQQFFTDIQILNVKRKMYALLDAEGDHEAGIQQLRERIEYMERNSDRQQQQQQQQQFFSTREIQETRSRLQSLTDSGGDQNAIDALRQRLVYMEELHPD